MKKTTLLTVGLLSLSLHAFAADEGLANCKPYTPPASPASSEGSVLDDSEFSEQESDDEDCDPYDDLSPDTISSLEKAYRRHDSSWGTKQKNESSRLAARPAHQGTRWRK